MPVTVLMHRADKFHIRQDCHLDAYKTFFLQNFGCSRKIYNLYCDILYKKLEELKYQPGETLPEIKFPEITKFKDQYEYLKEADSLGLCNAKIAFDKACERFDDQEDRSSYTKRALRRAESGTEPLSFKGLKGMPKFHSKAHGDFSYTTNCQYPDDNNNLKNPTIWLKGNKLHLPKMKRSDYVVLDESRSLPMGAVIGNVTVSMDNLGEFYASIEYTYAAIMDTSIYDAACTNDSAVIDKLKFIGLDYSQQNFYVDSEGRKANYPHYYRKSEEKLARLQRQLSHMQKDSQNYKKQLKKIQALHKKIANQRKDFVNQEAAYLSRDYDVVAVEDLDLRAMGGALTLGKNLHDNGFGMFRTQLDHKLEAKGSLLVKVSRSFPSTKRCHCCGFVNKDVVLGVTEWVCPNCGEFHDRDENAAINICNEGRRIFPVYCQNRLAEQQTARNKAAALSEGRKNKSKTTQEKSAC